jgi:hypothetical protein
MATRKETTMLTDTYSLPSVATATGATQTTIKSWLHKGVVVGANSIIGGGQRGKPRHFTLNSVIEIGVAKCILDNGPSDLASAFHAANIFAHTGWNRNPAMPFNDGGTLMFVSGQRAEILNYQPGQDYDPLVRAEMGDPEAFLRIDIVKVFYRIVLGLGLDPRDVMAASYGDAK